MYASQVESATARAVVEQGTALLRARLQPDEVLLWVGCSGITPKPRAQLERESFCADCFTPAVTISMALPYFVPSLVVLGLGAWLMAWVGQRGNGVALVV